MAVGGKVGDTFTEINVTPLTDVFLVLLVIMILVAPLINQTVLKVDPPQANSNSTPPPPDKFKIDVEVLGNGQIKINGTPCPNTDSLTVQQMLQAEQQKGVASGMAAEDIPLNLASEPDSLEKNVVAVMDAAAGAGLKKMRVLPLRNISGGAAAPAAAGRR